MVCFKPYGHDRCCKPHLLELTREALVFLFVVYIVSEVVFVKMPSRQRKARAKRRAEYL